MKKFAWIVPMLLVAACAKEVVIPEASSGDVTRVADKYPGITLEQLNQGKVLYVENCGKCHKLYAPSSRIEESWQQVTPPMAKKARLNAEQEKLILQYLVSKSK